MLFVGADVLILYDLERARSAAGGERAVGAATRHRRDVVGVALSRRRRTFGTAGVAARRARVLPDDPADRGARRSSGRSLVGVLAIACGIWAGDARRAPARLGRGRVGPRRDRARRSSRSSRASDNLNIGLPRRPDRVDVRLLDAARLRRHRRHVLRAQRRREHRPRGDDADGRVLRRLRRRQGRELGRGHRSPRCSPAG